MAEEPENEPTDDGGDAPAIKIVVVGDGAVGKTCLLICYTRNEFPKTYVPTVFDNSTKVVSLTINETQHKVSLDLWDTAGQEELDRIRYLSYRDTHIVLLCFSVVSMSSFENISQKWIPEIKHHAPEALLLLVGLKSDLRQQAQELNTPSVPVERINVFQKECGAIGYVECSALLFQNIDTVFETAIKGFLVPPSAAKQEPSGCCLIL